MRLNPADNHFELFGMQPGFNVESARLESQYRELQSLLHPDRHATAGAQEKRLAVQGAALVNQAYAVLSDDCMRAAYLLELKGVEFRGEPDTVDDPEFLMRQMELREMLEQSAAAPRPGDALDGLDRAAAAQMAALAGDFKRAYAAGEFAAARKTVLKMKFIKKFRAEVSAEVGGAHRRAAASNGAPGDG